MAVDFISYGYDTLPGDGLSETAFEEMHPEIGLASMGVRNPGDWKVTAVSGADRTVSIAAGRGWSHGVIDKTVANDTIQLDTVASGSRWDLIACRRDPTPSAGVSSFVKINGGSTPVIPGGRLSGPGIRDQPLALVQVTAGQTQPTGFIDLRTWAGAGGGFLAKDDLVKSFLNQTGTRLQINGTDWIRQIGPNDLPEWAQIQQPSTSYTPLQPTGYSVAGAIVAEPVAGRTRVTVDVNVTRTGNDTTIGTAFAGFGAVLPSAVRGSAAPHKYLPVSLSGGGSTNVHATVFLNPVNGEMSIRGQSSFAWDKNALFTLNCAYYI